MKKTAIKFSLDENGNLVIPRDLFESVSKAGELLVNVNGRILQITDLTVNPAPLDSSITEADAGNEQSKMPHLLKLAESSMEFWDNPVDDAAWNDA